MEIFGLLSTLLELLVSKREAIARGVKRINLMIRRGKLRIVIFGPGGVGKTTVAKFLSNKLDTSRPREYEESLENETFAIEDLVAYLLVPPGQGARRKTTWPELFRDLENGRVAAILNVVAYGYHSLSDQEASTSDGRAFADYLSERRAEELRVLDEIIPHLRDVERPLRMITVLNKQDLWWDERDAVRRHYREGEYQKRIAELEAHLGSNNFTHDYFEASPLIQNLRTIDGTVLAKTVAGYDEGIQYNSNIKLVRALTALGNERKRKH